MSPSAESTPSIPHNGGRPPAPLENQALGSRHTMVRRYDLLATHGRIPRVRRCPPKALIDPCTGAPSPGTAHLEAAPGSGYTLARAGGVSVGATVLAPGVPETRTSRFALRRLNGRSVFSNSGDRLTDLAAEPHARFDVEQLTVTGSVAQRRARRRA